MVSRLSKGIETETGAGVRDAMSGYLKAAIAKDWPAMATGQDSSDVDRALDELFAATLRFHPADRRDGTMLSESVLPATPIQAARLGACPDCRSGWR
jgi:hypothetical protein